MYVWGRALKPVIGGRRQAKHAGGHAGPTHASPRVAQDRGEEEVFRRGIPLLKDNIPPLLTPVLLAGISAGANAMLTGFPMRVISNDNAVVCWK